MNLGSQPFPAPHDHESERMNALLGGLGTALGYERETSHAGPHVTRPAFRVKAEAAGAARDAETDAVTQFFEQQVPRCRDGQGLLVVMPLGVRAAFEVPARLAWRRLTRGLRRLRPGPIAA